MKKRPVLGHVTIQIRGDEELKERLEELFAAYSNSLTRSALSRQILEFILFVQKEIDNGAELILRKGGRERKIIFPGKLTLEFIEEP